MNVLVACEFSGIVRDAFKELGHNAWSCDLLPSERPGNHFQRHIEDLLQQGVKWDLMIAFPPCTHLCSSGARWFGEKLKKQKQAIQLVKLLWNAPVHRICIENPVGILSSVWMSPSQYVKPNEHGHDESKKTCLWLKNLPRLESTSIVEAKRSANIKHGWKNRSRTYEGIAKAMAAQWGSLPVTR